ncbi:hypothetical protein PAXINDRAFT_84510, partial [Paxillus involutus ATCC 200175]
LTYAALGEFNLLKHSWYDILAKLWMNPTHREMAIKHFKVVQAKEEIIWLNVKICHLKTWVNKEDSLIKGVALRLEMAEPVLAAEIWARHRQQHRINDVYCSQLTCIDTFHDDFND